MRSRLLIGVIFSADWVTPSDALISCRLRMPLARLAAVPSLAPVGDGAAPDGGFAPTGPAGDHGARADPAGRLT
jgi:hypothetical protein